MSFIHQGRDVGQLGWQLWASSPFPCDLSIHKLKPYVRFPTGLTIHWPTLTICPFLASLGVTAHCLFGLSLWGVGVCSMSGLKVGKGCSGWNRRSQVYVVSE